MTQQLKQKCDTQNARWDQNTHAKYSTRKLPEVVRLECYALQTEPPTNSKTEVHVNGNDAR